MEVRVCTYFSSSVIYFNINARKDLKRGRGKKKKKKKKKSFVLRGVCFYIFWSEVLFIFLVCLS